MTQQPSEQEQPWPVYTQPAVSIRATWAATDGSQPEEVIIEWKETPATRDVIALTLAVIRRTGGNVETMRAPQKVTPPTEKITPPATECGAMGEGHTSDRNAIHWCVLAKGHDAAEPGGREHRCLCGGLFAADGEIPDVPGRRSRERRDR